MRALIMAVFSAGLLVSTASFADDAKPVQPTSVSTDDANQVTCRPVAHEGEIVHRSECHTQREWRLIQFRNQQAVRQYQQQTLFQHQ